MDIDSSFVANASFGDPLYAEEDPAPTADELLSYSDTTPQTSSLAARIGSTKVYLWEDEMGATANGKRKRSQSSADDDDEPPSPSVLKYKRLLLTGPPIRLLPTARLFAYVAHFGVHPLGMEWINDQSCVMVFNRPADGREAWTALAISGLAGDAEDGDVTAHPIPLSILPLDTRVTAELTTPIETRVMMRWAREDDVKKRGAKHESEFYKREGKRQRRVQDESALNETKADLDAELDAFLEEGTPPPVEEESRMRSDYIADDGRTLLERTSVMRAVDLGLPTRVYSERGSGGAGRRNRRADSGDARRGEGGGDRRNREGGDRRRRGEGRRKGGERPTRSKEDLDDELEAFLREQ